MPTALPEMSNVLREQIVAECQALLDDPDASPLDLPSRVKKLSNIKWFRKMLSDFDAFNSPRLPYAPNDKTTHEDDARAAVERTILFLGCGREYSDGVSRWQRVLFVLFGVLVVGSILTFIGAMAAEHHYGEDSWAGRLVPYALSGMGIGFGSIFLFYVVGQFLSAIHIFRVRVLRQDLTPDADADIWPYLNSKDYLADLERV